MKIRLKDIVIKIECMPEYECIKGNAIASGDAELDAAIEHKIAQELESGNQWAWCSVRVTASIDGIDLEGDDYLGCCSYASENDFRACVYFQDMKHNAQADLLKKIESIQNIKIVA